MKTIAADDRGFLLGDGLFETLLVLDGRPVFFEAHMARLVRGCAALGLPAPAAEDVERALRTAAAEASLGGGRAAARITWTAGSGGRGLDRPPTLTPRLIASAAPASPAAPAVSLLTASVRRNEASPASRLKTLAYLDNVLARREALAAGADEALMLNTRGDVACAAAANVFWLADGEVHTPALTCGVLDGIMRDRVIAVAGSLGVPVREVQEPRAALDRAEAIFLTNSLIGVRAVSRLDGVALGESEWVRRLSAAAP
jgi:aminodeoxychorismate lyase